MIKNELVSKTIKKLQKNNYVYKGKLQPPKVELIKNWKPRKQLLFKSTKFGDDIDRTLKKMTTLGPILQAISHIMHTRSIEILMF